MNKWDEITYCINDMHMDIGVLTETWLTGNGSDQVAIGDITHPGYVFHHATRTYSKGGGVAIITRKSRKIKTHRQFKATFLRMFKPL